VRQYGFVLSLGIIFLLQGCGGAANTTTTNPPPESGIAAASTQQWVTQFGTGTVVQFPGNSLQLAGELESAILPAPDGGIYATGYTLGAFPGFPENPLHNATPYLARFSAAGKQLWVQQYSGVTGTPTAVANFVFDAKIDASGNTYLCGSAYLDPSKPSNPVDAAFIVKYDPNGSQLWAKQFLVNGETTAINAAALSNSGMLFVAGVLQPPAAAQEQDFFVAALNTSDGSIVWQKTFGAQALDNILAAVADADGFYLAGWSSGPFPGSNSQSIQAFTAKLAASDGHTVWVQAFTDLQKTADIELAALAIAPDGGILVGGGESASFLVVGQGAFPSASALLLKLSPDSGAVQWQKTYSSGAGDQISPVAAAANGMIYATGSTNGVFNGKFSQPTQNLFLLKLDATGSAQWVQQFGTGDIVNVTMQFGAHVAVNSNNDVFVGAGTQGAYPGASNPNSAVEGFVMKFGP